MAIINLNQLFWGKNLSLEELQSLVESTTSTLNKHLHDIDVLPSEERTQETEKAISKYKKTLEGFRQTAATLYKEFLEGGQHARVLEILKGYYKHYSTEEIENLSIEKVRDLITPILQTEPYFKSRKISNNRDKNISLDLMKIDIYRTVFPSAKLTAEEIKAFQSYVSFYFLAPKWLIPESQEKTNLHPAFIGNKYAMPDEYCNDENAFLAELRKLKATYKDARRGNEKSAATEQFLDNLKPVEEKVKGKCIEIITECRPQLSKDDINELLELEYLPEIANEILFWEQERKRFIEILEKAVPNITLEDIAKFNTTDTESPLYSIFQNSNREPKKIIELLLKPQNRVALELLDWVIEKSPNTLELSEDEKEVFRAYKNHNLEREDGVKDTFLCYLLNANNLENIPDKQVYQKLSFEDVEDLTRQRRYDAKELKGLLSDEDEEVLTNYQNPSEEKREIEDLYNRCKKNIEEMEPILNDRINSVEEGKKRKALAIREAIYERGHLIRHLQQLIAKKRSLGMDASKDIDSLHEQIKEQREQTTKALATNKGKPYFETSDEIKLKYERLKASYGQLKASTEGNRQEALTNSVKDVISIAGSIAEAPVREATKAIQENAGRIASIATLPLQAVNYLSKKLNFESPFEGKTIESMSQGLAEVLKAKLEEVQEIIRKK